MPVIVLFDTAIGSTNLGDEIIFGSIKRHMEDILSQGTVIRFGTHILNFSLFQSFNNFKVNLCKDAKYKFICGTNLLDNRIQSTRIPQFQLNPYNIELYRNSILVGVGKKSNYDSISAYSKALYRRALSKEYIHSVRDDSTKLMLESIGLRAVNTGCPTLWGLTPDQCARIPKGKAGRVVFSLSSLPKQQDRINDQKIVDIINRNYKEVYAWIQTTNDERYISSLDNTQSFRRIYSLESYGGLLEKHKGECDYVGTRLHGGIFALQHLCRSIIISIDHRSKGVYETNNIPMVQRSNPEEIERMIQSEFPTEIVLPDENIRLFLSQFTSG